MEKALGVRQERKQKTRRKLVDTTLSVFSAQGICGTNTAELAKKVGVSHGTVFLHFPTRDELLVAVMDEFGARLSARFNEAAKEKSSLKAVLEAHLSALADFEDFYARLVAELPQLPAQVRSQFFMLQSAISYRVFQAAQEEMKRGALKKIERPLLFNTWLGLLHHYLANRELFSPKGSLVREKGGELLAHFLHLVRK